MTIINKSTLKGYFNYLDQPSEANFADWIETMNPREYRTVGPAGSDADYICDSINDEVQIQEAIDAVAALPEVNYIKKPNGDVYSGIANSAKVILLRGAYGIYDTINLKSHVELVITENAALYPMVDVNIINMKTTSRISGGGLITTAAFDNYSSSVIFINGQEHIYQLNKMFIRDLYLQGCPQKTGTAINFYAIHPSDMGYICNVEVSGIIITNFQYGIKIEQDGNCWIGCNTFSNILMYATAQAIYINNTADWWGPYNNMFSHITIQQGGTSGGPSTNGIYCNGWQNYFEPIMIWDTDIAEGGIAVEFMDREKCMGNHIEGRLEEPIINPSDRNFVTNYGG